TGKVRGSQRTESIMPATSSITITPGSSTPSSRSTRDPAQMPTSVTPASVAPRLASVNGIHQSATSATRLPTVPGATGEYPAPPTLATTSASRSVRPARSARDQLVAVHLYDRDVGEAPGLERAVAQQHHAIDLRRLARQTSFERERRIGAPPVDEDGLPRAVELLLARPREAVLRLLHEPGALLHDVGRDRRRHGRGGCSLLR